MTERIYTVLEAKLVDKPMRPKPIQQLHVVLDVAKLELRPGDRLVKVEKSDERIAMWYDKKDPVPGCWDFWGWADWTGTDKKRDADIELNRKLCAKNGHGFRTSTVKLPKDKK